jgi:tetratricopeptide (TPR) repeat protein
MLTKRVQRRIDRLLDQAEEAADRRDWNVVQESAQMVLSIDPENSDAATLITMVQASSEVRPIKASVEPIQETTDIPTAFADGRYVVDKFLGEGGKKKVYLAHDKVLDRDIAFALIKMDGLDDVGRTRITREAQAMGRLGTHPNVVAVLDIGEHEGQPWMVNELLGGGDVEELIEGADGGLELGRSLEIAIDTCRGLQFAHQKGIIHRDIKPANIWMTDDGTAKVGDYGLAIATDRSRLTQEKMMVGTVSYMPPEQATGGEITPKSDLYSLGAMLYEMVTGRPPFLGDDDIAIIGQHINTPPVSPQWHRPEIPAQLDSLIMRLLSKNPAERPDSADDVLSAFEAIELSGVTAPEGGEVEVAVGSLDSMASGVFVGRRVEMDQLKAKLEGALSGRGGMVALVGEPGIGKTRTSIELETYAGLRNAQVLWGRCYEGGGAPPYWPWVQAIRSYVSTTDPDQLRTQMGSTASVIAEVVEDIKERLPGVQAPPKIDDPESARFRLFDSISTFLKNAARVKPIVLILDDLHWSDKPSLLLLEFLARELASSRILLVGTYRDMELNRRHPLSVTLGDLTRERLFERVLLRGLVRGDVSSFIEIAAGVIPPRGLIDAVYTQTEGNPLFITETVRLLIQEKEFAPDKGSRSDSSWNIRIPEGVREVIGRRLDRLSERCNEVLTIAAVIGRQFTLDQLNVVVEDSTENQMLDVIDDALSSRTIEELPAEIGLYQFTHALIQETLLGELSATRKVRMHALIATAFEELYGSDSDKRATELASHFIEAEAVVNPSKVLHYAALAGEQAYRGMAFEEGIRLFEVAVRVGETEPDTADKALSLRGLGVSIGQDHYVNSQPAFNLINQSFEIFKNLGLNSEALETADSPVFHPMIVGGTKMYSDALQLAGKNTRSEAILQIRYGNSLMREEVDIDGAKSALSRAIEIADSLGDLELRLRALSDLENAVYVTGDTAESKSMFDEITELISSNRLSGPNVDESQANLLHHSLAVLLELGETDEAKKSAELLKEIGARLGYPRAIMSTLGRYLSFRAMLGDFEPTLRSQESALRGMEMDAVGGSNLAYASNATGDITAGLDIIERAKDIETSPSGSETTSQYWLSPAALCAYRLRHYPGNDRIEDAELLIELAVKARGVVPSHKMSHMVTRGLISVVKGDSKLAESCLIYLADHVDRIGGQTNAIVGRIVGVIETFLEKYDDAANHFEGAIDFARVREMLPELAWAHSDYAEMLIERNDPGDLDKITKLQDEAIAITTEIGMKPLLERVLGQREILKA